VSYGYLSYLVGLIIITTVTLTRAFYTEDTKCEKVDVSSSVEEDGDYLYIQIGPWSTGGER